MHTPTHRCLLAFTSLTSIVSLTLLFGWGPLTPPGGAVTSTAKPLSEVEPRIAINAANTPGDADSLFRITARGSYYLTGNITGVAGKSGIEIAASGVTVDLNGFDLLGVAGSVDGIVASVGSVNLMVVNGTVRAWGGDGVDLYSAGAVNCRVERVVAANNTNFGIITFLGTTISGCSAHQNGAVGIYNFSGGAVTACTASLNGSTGIVAYSGGTISGCAASENTGTGIDATSGTCTLTNCSAYDNSGDGISAFASTVSYCTASYNSGKGITIGVGSSATDCTLTGNTLDGILCASRCTIRGNTCSLNGNVAVVGADGAGIHADGIDNLIEGNNCVQADRGIDVDFAGNIIIKNTCSGNTTNWDIVANNVCGPILDRSAPASAAINGNSAPDSTGSTHPNANFSF